MSCCASCGTAEVDNVKLKKCACNHVQYCSVDCQKNHRSQHKKACKKRIAKIRDDKLFRQNEISHYDECPICCLPLPLDKTKTSMISCCCKLICKGCDYANFLREKEQGLEHKCPYCREPLSATQEEKVQNELKRAKANDPVALCNIGCRCHGEGDYEGAIKHWTKAAALGNAEAHFNLSIMYDKGEGVERDLKKKMYHLEEAAMVGHPEARYNIGVIEGKSYRVERAMRHFIIAANLGFDDALEGVKKGFAAGLVSKEDYAASLRGHQAAVEATKSKQREEADLGVYVKVK